MAREYAKNWFSMWTDNDFCTQPILDKLLYNVLLGQPVTVLNYAGIQTLNFKRLRKAMRDGDQQPTEHTLKRALIRLERRRYVFTDDDTGESLIRSFMRRDEVYKQPNVMLSALRAAAVVESPKLACVLLDELTSRIVLPEIAGDSPKANSLRDNLKLTKTSAIEHLQTLCEGLSEPFPEPFAEDLSEPFPEGLPRPGEMEPFPKPFPEGFAMGSVGVEVEVSKSPTVGGHLGGARTRNAETGHTAAQTAPNEPPAPYCPKHMPDGTDEDCGACGGHRRYRERWDANHANDAQDAVADFWAEVRHCPDCDDKGLIDYGNRAGRCPNHDWSLIHA